MSAVCELTGKKNQSGHKVSHSQIKTKRKFNPNLQSVTFYSPVMDMKFSFTACARAIKTIDKVGTIDTFLLESRNQDLTVKSLKIKKLLINRRNKVNK